MPGNGTSGRRNHRLKDNAKLRKTATGHKADILKKAYGEVGIGIRLGVLTDGGVGATMTSHFGARL